MAADLRSRKAKNKEKTKHWIRKNLRVIRSHLKWMTAKAKSVANRDIEARRLAWCGTRLATANIERCWFELATFEDERLKDAQMFLRAYESYLDSLQGLRDDARRDAFRHRLPRLMRRARNCYGRLGERAPQALASKYFEVIRISESEKKFSRSTKQHLCWIAGSKLFEAGQYEFAFELLLNALRLGSVNKSGLIKLAEVANELGWHGMAQALWGIASGPTSPRIEDAISPGTVEEAVLSEVCGHASRAVSFYKSVFANLTDCPVGKDLASLPKIGALRICADGLIIHAEPEVAAAAAAAVGCLAQVPENIYCECLGYHLGPPKSVEMS